MQARSLATAVATGVVLALVGATGAQAVTFTNSNNIAIPNSGTSGNAGPYGSPITVSGVGFSPNNISVTLHGLSHTFPDDIDIALVGPTGRQVLLMTDAGGGGNITNRTLTFDRGATQSLPDGGPIVSGTYLPSVYGPYNGTLPAGTMFSSLSAFNGVNPNGTWKLFVYDDAGGDVGAIASGWSLNIIRDVTSPSVSYSGSATRTVTRGSGDDDATPKLLSGTASDNRGVTQVRVRFFSAGDSDVGFDQTYTADCPSCSPTSPFVSWSLDLLNLSPAPPAGTYETRITARDGVGNTTTIVGPTVTFTP